MPGFDAEGWAKIITATFAGMKDLLLGVKEVAMAVGIILGVMYGADNSSKLKAQADKIDAAAVNAAEAKKAVAEANIDRNQHLASLSTKVEAVSSKVEDVKAQVAKVVETSSPVAPPAGETRQVR